MGFYELKFIFILTINSSNQPLPSKARRRVYKKKRKKKKRNTDHFDQFHCDLRLNLISLSLRSLPGRPRRDPTEPNERRESRMRR